MYINTPHKITVLSAALITNTDGYGGKVRDWTNATSEVVPAQVQPVTTSELLESGERDQVVTRWRIWTYPWVSVSAADRVQWNDLLLSIDGDPQRWADLWGTPDHVEFLAVISAG